MRLFFMLLAVGVPLFSCGSGDLDTPMVSDTGIIEDAKFLTECDVSNDECGPDLYCYNFNTKGSFCTHSCELAEECGEPSSGCNGKGVCKAP